MNKSITNWLLFIVLTIIWGSSFVLMKLGLRSLTAYQVATLRILSAGVVMIPFFNQARKQIPNNKKGFAILSALLGSFFPAYLFCIAETQVNSSIAGILNALTPIFTLLVGAAFFSLQLASKRILGIVLGFLGMVLLCWPKQGFAFDNQLYNWLIVLATLLYGINVNMVGKYLKQVNPIHIVAYSFVILIVPCLIILYLTNAQVFFSKPVTIDYFIIPLMASVLLGVLGTAVASISFYNLIKRAGTLFASMVTYCIPFVALFWGLLAHEYFGLLQGIGLVTILIGVYITNKYK